MRTSVILPGPGLARMARDRVETGSIPPSRSNQRMGSVAGLVIGDRPTWVATSSSPRPMVLKGSPVSQGTWASTCRSLGSKNPGFSGSGYIVTGRLHVCLIVQSPCRTW